MKSITAIAAGLSLAFSSSAFAHSGAGVPHVHLDHVSDGTPAHVAGLAIIALIILAAGTYWMSQTSSRTDKPQDSLDHLRGGKDAE